MAAVAIPCGFESCDTLRFSRTYCERSGSTRRGQVRAFSGRNLLRIGAGDRNVGEIRSLKGVAGSETLLGRGRRSQSKRRATTVQMMWGKVEAPKPTSLPMVPITSEEQFDQILSEAQERNEPVIIDWLAAWCRKCIYLKPKMEKLAAEYHPDVKFYVVDVNTVPQSLVKRASVTKMPTIQLWKNGKWWGEVIGGHQAWIVMDEVRELVVRSRDQSSQVQ